MSILQLLSSITVTQTFACCCDPHFMSITTISYEEFNPNKLKHTDPHKVGSSYLVAIAIGNMLLLPFIKTSGSTRSSLAS